MISSKIFTPSVIHILCAQNPVQLAWAAECEEVNQPGFILSRAELGACPCPVSRGADIFVLISPSLFSPPLQLSTSHEDTTLNTADTHCDVLLSRAGNEPSQNFTITERDTLTRPNTNTNTTNFTFTFKKESI